MVRAKLMKRLQKEIELLCDYYGVNNVNYLDCDSKKIISEPYIIDVYKCEHLFCNIKITLHYNYPFDTPLFQFYFTESDKSIRTINYYDFFKKSDDFYRSKVTMDEYVCPCCHHVLCTRTLNQPLVDLSKDVQNFGIQYMRLRERYFFGKYINFQNKLNKDIINIILNYI